MTAFDSGRTGKQEEPIIKSETPSMIFY